MRLHALAIAGQIGCAQILGLDNTTFDQKDAQIDAPGICDGAPACTAFTGRSLCGQLIGTGTTPGPVRVAAPTGDVCSGTEGPCGLSGFGQPLASFFTGTTTDQIPARIDDCGRFVVPDLDASIGNVAIVVQGASFSSTARLVFDRPTIIGTDTGIDALVVTSETRLAWATQMSLAETDVASGYLVRYKTDPLGLSEEARVDGAKPPGPPPTPPWAAYFGNDFELLDPALVATGAEGTALIVPNVGTFKLGGFRPGKQCERDALQRVLSTLIFVTLDAC